MSRRWVLFLSALIMLALALVVARVFREPLPSFSEDEAVDVGDSVTGSLQSEPVSALPSPLPSPEAMIMSSGDSTSLPVTTVEPKRDEGPAGVAPVVRDATSGSVQVTEPPAPPAAPQQTQPASSEGEGSGGSSSAVPVSPEPDKEESAPSVVSSPPSAESPAPSPPPASAGTPEAGDDDAAASSATSPATSGAPTIPEPAPASAESPVPAAPVEGNKADKALKPGTLVTKSSLPAKAGSHVVSSATLTMDGDVVTLTLQGTSAMRGKTFILAEPDRVVLDIEGDWKVEAPRVPSNRMVRSLRVGAQDKATRLVFDMRVKPVKVKVANPGADSLELTIR